MESLLDKYILLPQPLALCVGKLSKSIINNLKKKFKSITTEETSPYVFCATYTDFKELNITTEHCFIFEEVLLDNYSTKKEKGITIVNPHNFSSTESLNQFTRMYSTHKEALIEIVMSKVKLYEPKKFWSLVEKGIDDADIYTYLQTHNKMISKESSGYYYAQTILNIIKKLPFKYTVTTYLDFGAGKGAKTYQVMKLLKLDVRHVYALDLKDFYSLKNSHPYGFNYIYYDGITLPKIPIKFNLITITHVLHHITAIHDILEQLAKIQAKNCLIIIKEHDCFQDDFAPIIDIEHALYELVCDKSDNNFLQKYWARYFTKNEAIKLFELHGYKSIKLPEEAPYANPSRIFFAAFYKE